MNKLLLALVALTCLLATTVSAFTRRSAMSMKVKEVKPLLNLPRKIKRLVRAADTADKFNAILSDVNDQFLKELTQDGLRENILSTINKKAAYLKIPVKANFGVKPTVALPTIVETAQKAGTFKTLIAALEAADLVKVLAGAGQFTVFAPSDEAFAALEPGTVEGLLADKEKLTAVLTYHVLPSIYKSKKVAKVTEPMTTVNAAAKLAVKVDKTDKSVAIGDGAKIVAADLFCSNGVVHVVDKVLIPK